MADLEAREAKLIQYLNEAYGKEKELETALQAHIAMTTRDAYKKRLKDHLKETKAQAKGLERRIKQLGGKAEGLPAPGPDVVQEAAGAVVSAANKAVAAAKGPMHALRGTGEQEKMLKNAKTEYFNEAEEIANYNAIETLAEAVGDRDTAKLAKEYRRQEERMSKFLDKTIVALTKEVVKEEIPASQRKSSRSGPSRSRASSKAGKSSRSRSSASRASTARSSSSRASSNSASGKSKSKAKSGSSRSRSTTKK